MLISRVSLVKMHRLPALLAGALAVLVALLMKPASAPAEDDAHHHAHGHDHGHHHAHRHPQRKKQLESYEQVAAALADPSPSERRRGLEGAVLLPAESTSRVLPLVLAATADREATIRADAAHALRVLNIAVKAVQAALVKGLTDSSTEVQKQSAISLGSIFQGRQAKIPELEGLLSAADPSLRFRAADAMLRIAEPAAQARAACALATTLTDKITLEREERQVHPAAYLPAAKLDELGNNLPERVREGLTACDRTRVTAELERALSHQNNVVRAVAGKTIRWWGKDAPETLLPLLVSAIRREEFPAVKRYLLEALVGRPFRGPDVLAVLRESTGASSAQVRSAAYAALGELPAAGALPLLMKGLDDAHPAVRIAATRSIGSLGAEAKSAVAALVPRLKENGDPDEVGAVMLALKGIGTPEALAELERFVAKVNQAKK